MGTLTVGASAPAVGLQAPVSQAMEPTPAALTAPDARSRR